MALKTRVTFVFMLELVEYPDRLESLGCHWYLDDDVLPVGGDLLRLGDEVVAGVAARPRRLSGP